MSQFESLLVTNVAFVTSLGFWSDRHTEQSSIFNLYLDTYISEIVSYRNTEESFSG